MASEELASVVDRSWMLLPLARKALATLKDDPTVSASAGDLGRRLFRLAAGFKSCGEPILGRLVFGLGEAFTELSLQNLTRSEQTFDVVQMALSDFGDLLVELDATGQITQPEPIESLALLEAMIAPLRISPPAAIDFERVSPGTQPDPMTDLRRCGDALVSASESLLNRIQRDDASPYSAPVSRIHHLASTICERLNEISPVIPTAKLQDDKHDVEQCPLERTPVVLFGDVIFDANLCEKSLQFECAEIAIEHDVTELQAPWLPTNRPPKVLVIDESPFFRMLLRMAIESTGHATLTLANLDEAEELLNDSQASDIVIWGGVRSSIDTDCLSDWILRRDDSRRPLLVGLVNGTRDSGDMPHEFDYVLPRTDLPQLLSIIRSKLGDVAHAIKKTA